MARYSRDNHLQEIIWNARDTNPTIRYVRKLGMHNSFILSKELIMLTKNACQWRNNRITWLSSSDVEDVFWSWTMSCGSGWCAVVKSCLMKLNDVQWNCYLGTEITSNDSLRQWRRAHEGQFFPFPILLFTTGIWYTDNWHTQVSTSKYQFCREQ